MTVGSGQFQLYSRIEPPLKAGDYRFRSEQHLSATGHPQSELAVDGLDTHVRVRSPQYVLPPDQVLSTFPPAGREGSFGARLPQIVIRRRTLPWERRVAPGKDQLPWLALVVIAEGEAELVMNEDVADCVTTGVELDTPADVEKGNCLEIRKSMVDRIFPTQEEVGLLAHAREVDLNDTELMMGDDDGFLAVVIANRLPVPGRDAEGRDTPVKYLACLVNLCEQFPRLLEKAPDPKKFTVRPEVALEATTVTLAESDHLVMGTVNHAASALNAAALGGKAVAAADIRKISVDPGVSAPYENVAGWATSSKVRGTADVYAEMARDFHLGGVIGAVLDPVLRFPVLIHWSFTTVGDETFESLMKGLNSGLLGTTGETDPGDNPQARKPTVGRLPLEVVETGHVGLPHRLRRGDEVRSWYRGPLLPHPPDVAADRLPLAHAADQIRVVVPDGREDVSLAAAFEIGRLLGLSRTSMVASLMRWRQQGFQAARRTGTLGSSIFAGVGDRIDGMVLDRFLGGAFGALVGQAIVGAPELVLGNPNPLVSAGRPVVEDVSVNEVLAAGFGVSAKAFEGGRSEVLGRLGDARPRLPRGGALDVAAAVRAVLSPRLDTDFARIAIQSLAADVVRGAPELGGVRGLPIDLQPGLAGLAVSGFDPAAMAPLAPHAKGGEHIGDALDRLVEDRAARAGDEGEEDLG